MRIDNSKGASAPLSSKIVVDCFIQIVNMMTLDKLNYDEAVRYVAYHNHLSNERVKELMKQFE